VDNIFPHHENEIAQSEAYSGKKFVNYWLHCRHLIVDGEKMSKSKGNQYTLRDLLKKDTDPLTLRFLLFATHYRKMLNFTFEGLRQAHASLQRLKYFIYELQNRKFKKEVNKDIPKLIEETRKKFIEGLSNDLNISVSLTALFEMIKKVNILITRDKLGQKDAVKLTSLVYSLDQVLAVLPEKEDKPLSSEIEEKIKIREKARAEKNYELADKIRQELLAQGIVLEDTKEGVRWKIVKSKSRIQ